EGSSGLALGFREPYRPVLADLTGQRRPRAVAVDGLDVVLPFQPALAVRDDAGGPVERVVVGAPHVAGLAAWNRRVARARPLRIGRVRRPARRTLIARPVVEIRDPPGPESRRRLQIAHLPAPGATNSYRNGASYSQSSDWCLIRVPSRIVSPSSARNRMRCRRIRCGDRTSAVIHSLADLSRLTS